MNSQHTCKDGKRLFVSQMEDLHLVNTVRLICRRIEDLKQIARGIEISETAVFYGVDSESNKIRARERLYDSARMIEPYAAECALRGIDISELMQRTFGRSGAEKITIEVNHDLLERVDDDDEWELADLGF